MHKYLVFEYRRLLVFSYFITFYRCHLIADDFLCNKRLLLILRHLFIHWFHNSSSCGSESISASHERIPSLTLLRSLELSQTHKFWSLYWWRRGSTPSITKSIVKLWFFNSDDVCWRYFFTRKFQIVFICLWRLMENRFF